MDVFVPGGFLYRPHTLNERWQWSMAPSSPSVSTLGFWVKSVDPTWSQSVFQTWEDAAWRWPTSFHSSGAWNTETDRRDSGEFMMSLFLPLCVDCRRRQTDMLLCLCCLSLSLHFFFCNWPNLPGAVRCCSEIGFYCFLLRDKSSSSFLLKPL